MNHNNVPMTEILPYLYLGNRSDADNVARLIKNGIGFILNLTTSATEYPKDSKIILRHINILDSVSQCLKKTYQEAFDFIDEAQKCNSKVLIHCEAGISRSPTITVAYLIYKKKMEALEAYNFVKKLRPIVSPNFGFMGQLMELEYELVPEKVKLRLEKEAVLQKEATKLREERLKASEEQAKHEVQKPLVEKVIENSKNKLQLGKKSIKIAIKPTSLNIQIIHKKPNSLPKPLSIDLKSPVLNATANKYVLPTNENANLDQPLSNQNLNLNQDLENQNQINLNISSIINPQLPKTISNSSKCNQTSSPSLNSSNSSLNNKQLVNISSLSSKIQNKDCLKQDDQPMPKSTSQPQLINNSINKIHKSQSSIRDSNNNFDILNDEPIKLKSTSVDSKCNGIGKLIAIVNGKSEINLINNQMDSKEDKSTDKINDKLTDKLTDKPIGKINNLIKNDTKVLAKSSTTNSSPNSNATTSPSLSKNRHQTITPALCLSELLNPNSKSISQNSIFLINSSKHNSGSNNLASTTVNGKSQIKPLRPSTLLLNSNVPRKIKHNAITPSSLCSPLTAFAVSSTKSSPTFNHHLSSNLSSPFELSEKLVKRRWETEATSYQDLTKDFNPPDCKKKNKQKKLKNITVEVN